MRQPVIISIIILAEMPRQTAHLVIMIPKESWSNCVIVACPPPELIYSAAKSNAAIQMVLCPLVVD